MLFHGRQDAQIALDAPRVIIANILLDHLNKLVLAGEAPAIIAFPLQDPPEALHRAVVNAMRHAGHTLRHACLHKLVVEDSVGVLENPLSLWSKGCASGSAVTALSKVLKTSGLSLRSLST